MIEFCLTWEAYQKNICKGLSLLQQKAEFVDMTIAADGHHVKVHQMIMSLVSPYIKEIITSTQCPHPVIFLNKVSYETLQLILEYAYTGEVSVSQENLGDFLEACTFLHVKGLEHMNIPETKAEDNDFLNFVGARGNQESNEPASKQTRLPRQTVITYNDNDSDELEVLHDNEVIIENSPMEDNTFSETGDAEEIDTDTTQTEQLSIAKRKANTLPTSTIQYSLTRQGSIQLVLNRYIYQMRHSRRNNETMWRCINYNRLGCSAIAVTRENMVLKRGRSHNHPYHDNEILKRVQNGNMYTALNTVQNIASLNKTLTQPVKI